MRGRSESWPRGCGAPLLLAFAWLVAVAASPASALAEQPSGEDDDAPAYETVVVAQPEGEGPEEVRISRDRLEETGSRSLAGALEREGGIYATTGSRGERSLQVRGFEQRQLYLVIDGVPAYIPYDGQLDLGKIPVDLVEDVIVLRGPGTLRYGPGGMGGTLSIRTRQPGTGPLLRTRFDGGRGRHVRLSGSHTHRAGPFSWLVGAGSELRGDSPLSSAFQPTRNEDGGLRENSDGRLRHVIGRLRADVGDSSWIEGTAWHVGGAWGIPPSAELSAPRYWRMSDWRATVATIQHRWMPAPRLVLQELLFVGLFDNLIDAFDDATYSSQETAAAFHSWYHDQTAGGWARLRYAVPGGVLLRLEAGARYERHTSERDITDEDGAVSRVLILGAAQLESRLARTVELAASVQTSGETALAEAVRPSLDAMVSLSWNPRSDLSFGLAAGRRSRLPSLRERFSGASGVGERLPSPDLQPEVAFHVGLDGTYRLSEQVRLELSLFDAEVVDLIDQVPLSAGLDQFQNVARARLLGVEVLLLAVPLRWLELEAGYRYLHARSLMPGEPAGPLAYRPSHLARLGVRIWPRRWLLLSTTVRVVGPQQFQDPESTNWRRLGSYVVWDARVEVRPWPSASVWIEALNMLDYAYQTKYGYPDPGWQLYAGIALEIPRPRGLSAPLR